ncbi:hypothetical protein R5R35_000154 [Gryllus longicercus]|uniref:Nucleoporin NUP53 n=1 Tax=Gryllus longicercus TaxID=2509291 RepID=A0AAN9V3A7_9ORTH
MEPMSLGSPAGSPPSSSVSSPFLPAYLMGESMPSAISRVKPSSPTKQLKHVSFGNTPTVSPPKLIHGSVESERRSLRSSMSMEKSSGPPIKCLFDTLDESFASPKSARSSERSYYDMNSSIISGQVTQEKPLLSQSDTWVTVFGFPPSATAFIASQFANCGLIVDKRVPPKGNWMHLRFQTPHEAHKALSYNGKIFSGSIMLGVAPCQEQDILQDSQVKENVMEGSFTSRNTSVLSSPVFHPNVLSQSNSSNLSYLGTPVRIGNARPLSQTYRPGQSENEVLNQSNTPQKSTSMVTKAMEYVFGW